MQQISATVRRNADAREQGDTIRDGDPSGRDAVARSPTRVEAMARIEELRARSPTLSA